MIPASSQAMLVLLAAPLLAQSPNSFAQRLLTAHNAERSRIGIAPLAWSPELAAQAQVWADSLARRGRLLGGGFDPRVAEPEWIDDEGLRRIKRKTLARLREAIAQGHYGDFDADLVPAVLDQAHIARAGQRRRCRPWHCRR